MDGDSTPDPYQALDLPKDATLPQIRSAHRKLVLKCHPDKYAEGALKAAKQVEFQRIQQAYELLSDKITRMDYEARGMGRNNPTSRSNLFEVESSFPTAKPILKTHSRAPLPAGHTYTGEKQLSDGSISASLEDSSRVSPRFSRASAVVLRDWLSNHSSRPNPTDEEKENLKMQTGLNNTQITNWLTNARRRRMHSSPETAPRNPYDDSSSDDEYRPRISSASNGRSRREEEDRRLYAEGKRSGRTRGASYTENARTKDAKWNEHKDFAAQYMQAARKKANPVDEFRREPVASPDSRHESNYESQRRGSVITSDRPKLQRTKSSDSMDNSMRKMHHTMGSDYGGSEDEGYYRSRTTKRSRATSRQRSDSRNRAHSDAYEPPKQAQFVDVSEILSTSSRASPVTVSHSSQVADGLNGSAIRKLPPLKQASEEDIQKAEAMAALGIRSHLRYAVDVPPSLRAKATKECFCCLEAFPPSANAICLKCDHLWCSTCLSKLVRLAIDSRELWPPSCCSVKIPQMTLLDNIEENTNARYRLALQKKISIGIKCPRCWESFSDIRLVLHHHEEEHDLKNEMDTGKCISTKQSPIPIDVDSDDSTTSSSPRVSEASSPSTTMTEPDSDKETSPSSTSPSTSSLSLSKKAAQQWKMSQLPRIIFVFVTRAITHFLSLQTTAWFILVLATVATSITTSYSLQGQVPDPPPEIGDSNYYSLLSQSIIAICSLYYLMVPYLRGDEELPVRTLFYVCWTLSLCGAVTAPLIYSREWSKSVWCGFGSALAQVAATAFLFEHAAVRDRDRSLKRVRNETKVELQDGHDEEDDEEKYTDAVETHI